jgi:uncharacterized protein
MGLLLVKPYLGCNLNCAYCYEREYRKRKKPSTRKPRLDYDLEAVFKKMEEFKNSQQSPQMVLHGGEPLVMGKEDIRKILKKMKELTGHSGIQTNGFLIDDDFIQIFKECNTSVGLSYDGPGELSRFRPGTKDLNKKIEKMVKEGLKVSLIMVINKANAGTNRTLNKLKNYLLELDKMRVYGRLNPCAGAPDCELDEKRLKEVYLDLANFCLTHNLRWSPFVDLVKGLQGKSRVCVFMGCDPFHTPSATVIVGDGSVTNCMRTNEKEIILRHPAKFNTRDEILSQTPQEFGGCMECRYWEACHGGCPTQAINNDWRNRTTLCPVFKTLFQFYEKVLGFVGISLTSSARKCVGESRNAQPKGSHGDSSHGDWPNHGDSNHIDNNQQIPPPGLAASRPPSQFTPPPNQPHQDSAGGPHQDSHGDWPNHGDSGHGDWSNHGDSPHGDNI